MDALWSRLKDGGMFVYVEPGSPKGYRFVNSFRDWILEKQKNEGASGKEISIIAPCPHHNICPMASNPNSWCHFS